MVENLEARKKLSGKHVDLDYNLTKAKEMGITDRDTLAEVARPHTDRIADLIIQITESEADPGPDPDPDPELPWQWRPVYGHEEVARVKALPQYPRLSMHFMCLAGYLYRNKLSEESITVVYDMFREARVSGVRFVRTFLMNGKRSPSEKYIADALPWVTRMGIIQFCEPNHLYLNCCRVIEAAALFWGMIHRPTFWMDRYNYDIFWQKNHNLSFDGFRTPGALNVKINFMRHYLGLQAEVGVKLHTFEIENETFHYNWVHGAMIADQNLRMFRLLQENPGIDIKNVWTCSGSSEFSHANFVGPHAMMIDGTPRGFGSLEFKDRHVKPEYHGASEIQGFYDTGLVDGLHSAWRHLCFNEDGSQYGSYIPCPGLPWRLADSRESYEAIGHVDAECEHKGMKMYFTYFMSDCLVKDADGVWKEEYPLDKMNWDRTRGYHRVMVGP